MTRHILQRLRPTLFAFFRAPQQRRALAPGDDNTSDTSEPPAIVPLPHGRGTAAQRRRDAVPRKGLSLPVHEASAIERILRRHIPPSAGTRFPEPFGTTDNATPRARPAKRFHPIGLGQQILRCISSAQLVPASSATMMSISSRSNASRQRLRSALNWACVRR